MSTPLSCWVVTDGRRGIENQALGLAEALERLRPLHIQTKILQSSGFFKSAQPSLQIKLHKNPEDYGLKPPYPQFAIGCGRQAIAALMSLKKALGKDILTIYLQDPRTNPKHFDMVIAPAHDKLKGQNVLSITGSTNRVTNDRVIVETLKFGEQIAKLPTPRVTLLIGGKSKSRDLDEKTHAGHMQAVHTILGQNISLLISTSRRTPQFVVDAYKKLHNASNQVWHWDGVGANPYFAFLGAGDAILVTEDSTNMLTEACSTGKPVFTLPMKGKAGKFEMLYSSLAKSCNVEPFSGVFDAPDYIPLNETQKAATEVLKRLAI